MYRKIKKEKLLFITKIYALFIIRIPNSNYKKYSFYQ